MPKLRKDPPIRGTNGLMDWNDLKNRDPDRHYVWVALSGYPSRGWYAAVGYKTHTWDRDPSAVAPLFGDAGAAEGAEMIVDGAVLMSIEKDRHEEIEQYGAPGGSQGQVSIDKIDAYMQGPQAMQDLKKGTDKTLSVSGKISPLQAGI